MGYTKIFETLITSTIWQEPNDCRVLWITILALKNKDDVCQATTPALAKICDLSIEDTEKYLKKFQEPDTYSRSVEYEGRRIEKVEGGWFVLNGYKYRDLLRHEERKDYIREKVREHRRRKNVNNGKQCNHGKPIADTDTDTDTKKKETPVVPLVTNRFDEFWKAYPKKVAKQKTLQIWNRLKLWDGKFEAVILALELQKKSEQWTRDAGQYIPHPTTWLNQQRWEDEMDLIPKEKTMQEKIMEAIR